MRKTYVAKISRIEAVKMVNDHLDHGTRRPKAAHHYGRVEIRELLDAIYGLPNLKKLEELIKAN